MKLDIQVVYNDHEPEEIISGEIVFDDAMQSHYELLKNEHPKELEGWLSDHADVYVERELIDIRWVLRDDDGNVIERKGKSK